uniref:HECT-type E3 ubiquitin transferase n=1 Tax=Syphacia muris TaxID=451379 RepID=A0A0N5AR03_9BILA
MKIDLSVLRVCGAEVPHRCQELISRIESSTNVKEFLDRLQEVHEWQPQFGKSEMCRWARVLNMCDDVLEKAVIRTSASSPLAVDDQPDLVEQVLVVMSFTALLFENTITRSVYSSADHLLALLDTGNMEVLVGVLHLFQVMSKRSRYLSQHVPDVQRKGIMSRISAIAKCWNGKMRSFKMEDCCKNEDVIDDSAVLPMSYKIKNTTKVLHKVQLEKSYVVELNEYINGIDNEDEKIALAARLRLVRAFLRSPRSRMLCVVARLIAVSTLVYSRNLLDEWNLGAIIQDSFIEDTTKLLIVEKSNDYIVDLIKTEALKTLTSVVSLDGSLKLNFVVDCLGANSYHGFMARMARICVSDLCSGRLGENGYTSVRFCTALFSLLYHLAGYDIGGGALLSCGLTGTLLSVVSCHSLPLKHITFVTRVVRVVDIMTSLDANSFNSCNGMSTIINRLVFEVEESLKEAGLEDAKANSKELCHQQRAALIKSLLNFIKRAIQDAQFAESVSHIMDGGLPIVIKQIVARCSFFGASLFHNAISVVANFIYQEPAYLTAIQNKGLTDAIMEAVFRRELPTSRDVLSSLPNVFSALCLNERGLNEFRAAEPFEHFFKVLLSTKYITAMKRRRNEMFTHLLFPAFLSANFNNYFLHVGYRQLKAETSLTLGTAIDDLIRHQPSLRTQFCVAVGKVLERLSILGAHERPELPRCVMSLSNWSTPAPQTSNSTYATISSRSASQDEEQNAAGNDSSEDEDDESPSAANNMDVSVSEHSSNSGDLGLCDSLRLPDGSYITPLGEHYMNLGKVLETVLTQNSTSDNAEAFIHCGAATKLTKLFFVRHIPLEISQSTFSQLVSNIMRSLYGQTQNDNLFIDLASTASSYVVALRNILEKYISANIPEEQVETVVAQLCALSSLCVVLTSISKIAINTGNPSSPLKLNVLNWWNLTKSGTELLKDLQLLQSRLVYESIVCSLSACSETCVSSTQTENDVNGENAMINGSVATEAVPASMLHTVQLKVGQWKRSKAYIIAANRCQHQISELIAVLSKIAASGSSRNRRMHDAVPSLLDSEHTLAIQLFSNHDLTLKLQPEENPPVLMLYMAQWITNFHVMLFDDSRLPSKIAYHIMLSAFYYSGCHKTYFKLLDKISNENWQNEYPKQAEQLHLAWLQLAERLVNSYAFRPSKFRIPEYSNLGKRFNVEKYSCLCQVEVSEKLRNFDKLLIQKKNTLNFYKSVMSVYKELLNSFILSVSSPAKLIKKSQEERRRPVEEFFLLCVVFSLLDDVDVSRVERLVEMGFDREEAIDALIEHNSVSEAAEYIIARHRTQDDSQNITESCDGAGNSLKETVSEETKDVENADNKVVNELDNVTSLDHGVFLVHACYEVAPAFIHLSEVNDVELAFLASDFLRVLIEGADKAWTDAVLVEYFLGDELLKLIEYEKSFPGNKENNILLSSRLHLACLLWEDVWSYYLTVCEKKQLPSAVISLLYIADSFALSNEKQIINRYLAPACLWIDIFDKMWRMRQGQSIYNEVISSITWKYWDPDDRNSPVPWITYPPVASQLLSLALRDGKKGLSLTNGTKLYYVNFTDMKQKNMESHTERQIFATIAFKKEHSEGDMSWCFEPSEDIKRWGKCLRTLIPTLVSLLGNSSVDSWSIQALLMLTARITRDTDNAHDFLKQGGLNVLLGLKGLSCQTDGLLISLIIRHCLDDEASIVQIFEKIVRSFIAGNHGTQSRWHHPRNRGSRDWFHALRIFAPLCARHPRLFVKVMEKVSRKQKDQINAVSNLSEPIAKTLPNNAPVKEVISTITKCLLDPSSCDNSKKAFLVRLLAELAKSYSTVAAVISEYVDPCGQSALVTLFDRHLRVVNIYSAADEELSAALRTLATVIASCNHSPKVQEALINDMISCLHLAFLSQDEDIVALKVNAIAELFRNIRDACSSDSRASGAQHPNPILKLFFKKKVCIELAKVPWHLNLSNDRGVGCLNVVLRTLEELTRSINGMVQSISAATNDSHRVEQNPPISVTPTTSSTNDTEPTVQSVVFDVSNADQAAEVRNPEVQNVFEESNMEEEAHVLAEVLDESDSDSDEDEAHDAADETEHNEIDMDAESDEDEEDHDEAIMEEEGRGSDDEDEEDDDGFGLVLGDRAHLRFEDGDAEDTFLNANVYIEGLEEFGNTLAAISGTRVLLRTEVEPSRNDWNLSSFPPPQHPLLQRSLNSPLDGPPQRSAGYRFMIGHRNVGPTGLMAPGLHRQGAVRRWGVLGQNPDRIARVSAGVSAFGSHYFDIVPSRQRLFNESAEVPPLPGNTEHRYATMPSSAERLFYETRLLDGHTYLTVFLVAAQYLTNIMDSREKVEKKPEVEDKSNVKGQMDSGKKAEEQPMNVSANQGATITQSSETNDGPERHETSCNLASTTEGDETPTASTSQLNENSQVVESNGSTSADVAVAASETGESAEPMDTSDPSGLFFDAQENVEDNSLTPMDANFGSGVENRNNISNASMSTASTTFDTTNEQGTTTASVIVNEQSATASTNPSNPSNDVTQLLGGAEVPEGIDPEFLAALPEDIRAEVIRDHARQQRAQRLVQQSAARESVEPSGAASGVQPLDQEFLNALPPELQEEILSQHERDLRLSAERSQPSTSQSGVTDSDANEAAALIESLPPGLRAQVLADADDTVLQVLPQNVAAEARRLRATLEQQQVMRFARMLGPSSFGHMIREAASLQSNVATLGSLAGVSTIPSKSTIQLLDRDAIVTLILLSFVEESRLATSRLQRLIKNICSQSATCDFVVWCFMALIEKLNNSTSSYEDLMGTATGWIHQIYSWSALGENERAIKFVRNAQNVAINPAVTIPTMRFILETLTSLAKSYPAHFVPFKLRGLESSSSEKLHSQPPSQFWTIAYSLLKMDSQRTTHRRSSLSMDQSNSLSIGLCGSSFEDSALGLLMLQFSKPAVKNNPILQDKLLHLLCTIFQTLPDETMKRLGIDDDIPLLRDQMQSVVIVLTEGDCSEDGLNDGRTLLMEAIRTFNTTTRKHIYELLVNAALSVGQKLYDQIAALKLQLENHVVQRSPQKTDNSSTTTLSQSSPSSSRTTTDRYDNTMVVIEGIANSIAVINSSGCQELQLPAVKMLTEKNALQNIFLKTLQSIVKIREVLRKYSKQSTKNSESAKKEETNGTVDESMSAVFAILNPLWDKISDCLSLLEFADSHAALALQPAAEAFFLVYSCDLSQIDPSKSVEHPDAAKLIQFAEKHKGILNQVLRQSNSSLSDSPFSILIKLPRLLDFDVKRKFFRKQIQKLDERSKIAFRGDDIPIRVRRSHLFSDSFRELFRLRSSEWRGRFYIIFEGEEGQDAGGLLREWFSVITREIFDPNYALFITAPGDRVTYMINKASYINPEHLDYFKFVGRIIAKAVYENKLLDCYFTRAFYKHILSVPVRTQDIESEDPSYYKSLEFLLNNPVETFGTELTFSVEVEEFGVCKMRELKENGANIQVTDLNKEEYVQLVCQMKMKGSIQQQLNAFLEGFYDVIPKHLISMFNEQELELLISGLPNIDVDDLYANAEYKTYTKTSPQIQWFWKALRSFDQADRAKFLQFVTGTSKVPLQGFSALEGMNGVQKFSIHMDSRSPDRLPTAHTCFNQLDLPQYESYEKLRHMLLLAVRECTEGFGFA